LGAFPHFFFSTTPLPEGQFDVEHSISEVIGLWLPTLSKISRMQLYLEDLCQGRTQGGGLGVKHPVELDILQKLYYLRKEEQCFAYVLLVNLST